MTPFDPSLTDGRAAPAATPATSPLQDRREATLQRLGSLKVQPGVVVEMAQLAENDRKALVKLLEREPVISARVLAVLNSAQMGLRHAVRSIDRAVGLLGPTYTRSVALVYGMRGFCDGSDLGPKVSRSLWLASLNKAVAAKLAAQVLCPAYADEAFTAGLIQDVGLAPLAAVDPAFYRDQMLDPAKDPEPWCEREREHFGIDHTEVGQLLLNRWSMTGPLVQAIRHHHTIPEAAPAPAAAPAETEADPAPRDPARRLPGFIASLLPHTPAQPSPSQYPWLKAVHARFLMDPYNTPDAFLQAVSAEASLLAGSTATQPAWPLLAADAATDQVTALVSKLYRLDQALGSEQDRPGDLRAQAFTDDLTGLLNRRGFHRLAQRRLDEALAGGQSACCVMIDLDHFKSVNDRLGHAAGDQFLRGIAQLLQANIARCDLIGRVGGDEFAALFTGTTREEARGIVRRLCESCQGKRVSIRKDMETNLSFSLGAVFGPTLDEGENLQSLLTQADQAMYQSKRSQRGGWSFIDAAK